MPTVDHKESKRAYETLHQYTEWNEVWLDPATREQREREAKRKSWKEKIALRKHYFRFTFEE